MHVTIVRVEPAEQPTVRQRERLLDRIGLAVVAGAHHAKPGIGRDIARYDVGRPIGRSAIGDQNFEVVVILRGNAVEAGRQETGVVERRNGNADLHGEATNSRLSSRRTLSAAAEFRKGINLDQQGARDRENADRYVTKEHIEEGSLFARANESSDSQVPE